MAGYTLVFTRCCLDPRLILWIRLWVRLWLTSSEYLIQRRGNTNAARVDNSLIGWLPCSCNSAFLGINRGLPDLQLLLPLTSQTFPITCLASFFDTTVLEDGKLFLKIICRTSLILFSTLPAGLPSSTSWHYLRSILPLEYRHSLPKFLLTHDIICLFLPFPSFSLLTSLSSSLK
jgi:hypothetical protein